jgi:hypothetical protein
MDRRIREFEYLTIEQCERLKGMGFPQESIGWYIRFEGEVRYWFGTFPYEDYNPEEDEYPLVCEKIIASPPWQELEEWLGENIHLRYLGDEIGLWETHIENGPTATGTSRIEAAYNLVMAVKNLAKE